jgi:undecaprenyl diphosphate synthase
MSGSKKLEHIAFIMDGNRRWAKKLSNIASFGHASGGDNVEKVLALALDAKIPYVSMWALSKENILERDKLEIDTIFGLFEEKIPKLIPKLQNAGIRLEIIGDLWLVPASIRTLLLDAMEATKTWTQMTFVLAIAYSWQDEIVRAVKRCIAEWIDPKTLTEHEFLSYLDSGKYPPPDLIVRTGGSIRHSGFFLYQSAYSEYYFTDTLWPDFGPIDFQKALDVYALTGRNFGK